MTLNVLRGIRSVDYVSKKDNQRRTGFELFFTYEQPEISGYGCGSVYLSTRNYDNSLKLGDGFYIMYNQFGRADGILPVTAK